MRGEIARKAVALAVKESVKLNPQLEQKDVNFYEQVLAQPLSQLHGDELQHRTALEKKKLNLMKKVIGKDGNAKSHIERQEGMLEKARKQLNNEQMAVMSAPAKARKKRW